MSMSSDALMSSDELSTTSATRTNRQEVCLQRITNAQRRLQQRRFHCTQQNTRPVAPPILSCTCARRRRGGHVGLFPSANCSNKSVSTIPYVVGFIMSNPPPIYYDKALTEQNEPALGRSHHSGAHHGLRPDWTTPVAVVKSCCYVHSLRQYFLRASGCNYSNVAIGWFLPDDDVCSSSCRRVRGLCRAEVPFPRPWASWFMPKMVGPFGVDEWFLLYLMAGLL